ncbi:hypothetical protein BGZ51_003305 [Haplosporangium sp. Z 767]|nr:hypothetical protein BGZ51_003305 [Haplosporangium sp. Z 767]
MCINDTGVNVAIIDDGLDMTSEGLAPNFFKEGSWDFNDHTALPKPRLADDLHGTRCAGEIAAAKNDLCGLGVVWGPPDDGKSMDGPKGVVFDAMVNGIKSGRLGLRSIYVFATGNGESQDDDCNFDGCTNSLYTVSIGTIDHARRHPYYSEACSAQLAVTYSNGGGSAILDYGSLGAYALVEAAKRFQPLKPQPFLEPSVVTVGHKLSQNGEGLASTLIIMEQDLAEEGVQLGTLEHVAVMVNVQHERRRDVEVILRSPNNVESKLGARRRFDTSANGFVNWTFMTVKHWEENPVGEWTLIVRDQNNPKYSGTSVDWKIKFWGEARKQVANISAKPFIPKQPEEEQIMSALPVKVNENLGDPNNVPRSSQDAGLVDGPSSEKEASKKSAEEDDENGNDENTTESEGRGEGDDGMSPWRSGKKGTKAQSVDEAKTEENVARTASRTFYMFCGVSGLIMCVGGYLTRHRWDKRGQYSGARSVDSDSEKRGRDIGNEVLHIMATKGAYKRLTKEYINIQKSPPAYLFARPLERNILEWHYVLKGPPDTPYYGGEYYGTLVFPADYPFKPPSIRMMTPNGRFQIETRLCLSMSDFHPGTWNPSWSVSTILNGLLSFMSQDELTTGSITTTTHEKVALALHSHAYNLSSAKFREIFPELVAPQQVPLHIAFPNAPVTEAPLAPAPMPKLSVGLTQRKQTGAQRGAAGAGAVDTQGLAGVAGAADRAARRPSLFSMSQWHKWLAFFLVFAYLVIAKTITRATASASAPSAH